MKKIIINADDFGASKIVNKEIEKVIQRGLISSTTIMANGPAFCGVKEIIDKYQNISYGIHLNIVEFFPLTDPLIFSKYNLVDEKGQFIYQRIFEIKNFSKELLTAIKTEFHAQILRITNEKILISHIDGHQHCHAIYQLKDIINDLGVEFGINKIRRKIPPKSPLNHLISKVGSNKSDDKSSTLNTNNTGRKDGFLKKIIQYIKKYIQYYVWINVIKNKFEITDYFYSYYDFVTKKGEKKHKFNTIELMCHPGLAEFENETKMLLKNDLNDKFEYQLISYNDIPNKSQ